MSHVRVVRRGCRRHCGPPPLAAWQSLLWPCGLRVNKLCRHDIVQKKLSRQAFNFSYVRATTLSVSAQPQQSTGATELTLLHVVHEGEHLLPMYTSINTTTGTELTFLAL